MDSYRFLVFFGGLLLVLALIDFYFLRSWTRFVKQRGWHKAFYKIPWILSGLMIIVYTYGIIQRLDNTINSPLEKVFYILTAIWYIPKLFIIPVILIKDIILFFRRKISKKPKHAESNEPDKGRRKFVQTAGWALAGAPFAIVGYGALKTTYDFTIYDIEVPISKLPKTLDGLKIVQLSDIHAGSFYSSSPIFEVRWIVNRLKPDFIMLTGDFVNFNPDELKIVNNEFSNLKSKYGTLGCLGNHDHYMSPNDHLRLKSSLRDMGIDLLVNQNRVIDINGESIQVAGVDNSSWNHKYADFDKAMQGLDPSLPTIMLCHDPNNWDSDIRPGTHADLTLAGHTHGGQVGLELFGTYLSPVRMVYRQWAGLYSEKEQYLYINRGLGTTGPPVRVNMPPEISLITLKRPDNLT